MKLTFLGATETVTGSKYLITHGKKNILIDCGLFQGYKDLRLRNWQPLPINPQNIDAVILTHAHIDHSGYLPLLVKNGFHGKIFSTPGTKALCTILLPDSGYLQEEDAKHANRYGYAKHKPAMPLYTEADAKKALTLFETIDFETAHLLFPGLTFKFSPAGHIIGSAFVHILQDKTHLVFSGDMGRPHDAVMQPPTIIKSADYLVLESTYGDRLHDTKNLAKQLSEVINQTVNRGGSIIIPAFAVGRAQNFLFYLYQLKKSKQIPDIPIYLDSPMAINATHILSRFKNEHRLSNQEMSGLWETATYVTTADQSKELDIDMKPKIIISASGMVEGGRILHHLKAYAADANNTILFTGYQAGGTRGERIINGEKIMKIHGETIPILARIETIKGTSAHADYQEMIEWCKHFTQPPKKVFLTHGESNSSIALKDKLVKKLGWSCIVPQYKQVEILE